MAQRKDKLQAKLAKLKKQLKLLGEELELERTERKKVVEEMIQLEGVESESAFVRGGKLESIYMRFFVLFCFVFGYFTCTCGLCFCSGFLFSTWTFFLRV